MADGAPGVAAPGPAAVNQVADNGNNAGQKTSSIRPMPTKTSEMVPFGVGMGLGSILARGIMDNNPDFAAAVDEEQLTGLMQTLMYEITKQCGKSVDFFKELEDEEDKVGSMSIYHQ